MNLYFKKRETKFFDLKSKRKILWRFEVKSDNVYTANNKQVFAFKLLANLAVVTLL